MGLCRIFLLVVCMASAAAAGSPGGVWSGMAGMPEELEGQKLELRDELISSHLSYLAALDKAVNQLDGIRPDDPRHALAWARVEYLLETSFRLLESTGEYDAFLKTTARLRPDRREPAPAAVLGGDAVSDPDGGLRFTGADGRELRNTIVAGEPVLVDAGDRQPIARLDELTVRPAKAHSRRDGAYVPLIRARASWLRALALERLGRTREAGEETAPLDLIRDWVVLGPMEGVAENQSYLRYGLEEFFGYMDVTSAFPGADRQVRWTPHSTRDALGRFCPGALFRGEGLKSVYAVALIHSPANLPAVMRFGSNAATVVFVNHIMARRNAFSGLPNPDQEAFNVWLRKGWNLVLVRSSSASDDWTLAARITTPDGEPFPGYIIKPEQATLEAIFAEIRNAIARSRNDRLYEDSVPPESGGVSVLAHWLDAHPDDARANFYLASFLVAKNMMDGPKRFDRENIFRRAIEMADNDPFFTLMAARAIDYGVDGPDREENQRLVFLKAVADQGSAAALVDIGRLYLDVMRQPRRADEYAEMALTVNPMSLRAGVLDYDVAVDMGWTPVAKSLLEKLVRRHPSAAAARLRFGRNALAVGRFRQALTEFHALLGADATNREALDGAVVALGMLGQTSAAVDLLLGHIERFPYDFGVRLKLAELYRTLGRDEEARAVIDAALAMAPDDPGALALRRELDRETYAVAETGDESRNSAYRQELDLSPASSPPPNGWEYLYFQVEDRMGKSGGLDRICSFAFKIYTPRAARMLRHLGFRLDRDFERGRVSRLDVIHPDGERESITPAAGATGNGRTLKLQLPPLRAGMAVEAEIRIQRDRIVFLGDYFGHIAPLSQQAPVRLSRYMFTSPKDKRVFFHPANGAPEAMVVASADGRVSRIWEMSDLPAFCAEPHSPGQDELAPCVQVSAFGGWDEFAGWYWRLIGVQYHSPPELQVLAGRLGEGEAFAMGRLDNAAAWVAKNIGRRAWEYGPYAFRPINARSILSRLSADGKDRTLLICLLAREYGLQAWPVLARSRSRIFEPFGSSELALPLLDHFNHSLALVESPGGGGIFMDASNPYRPSAVMPSRLFGSPGMAIMPDRAERVQIPDGGVAACDWQSVADVVVDPDGSILWNEEITGEGTAAETLRMRFRTPEAHSDPWAAFLASIGATPSAAAFTFEESPSAPAAAVWKGRARLRRFACIDDGRVVLEIPHLPGNTVMETGKLEFPLSLDDVAHPGVREHDLLLPHGFRISRTIGLQYPPDWRLVNGIASFAKSYPFGRLSLRCEIGKGNATLHFLVEVPGHIVAARDFPAFREMAALVERWSRPELVWEKP